MKKIILLFVLLLGIFISPISAKYWPVKLMDRIHIVPQPKSLVYNNEKIPFPKYISIIGLSANNDEQKRTIESIDELFSRFPDVQYNFNGNNSFKIRFIRKDNLPEEGYQLTILKDGIKIVSKTATGEFYGMQTLYQILGFSYWGSEMLDISYKPEEKDAIEMQYVPLLKIDDEPQLKIRSFMLDLGRATFPLSYIKNIVKVMAHLKMNMLHLRLYDDELGGFRFKDLPLGSENPYAINSDDLVNIVKYARSYHITVMPEMESWGHVGSVVYHYPELFGAVGMWGGSSFGIGEKTYQLLEKMYDEIIPCLEDSAVIHVGLDEATWAVLPGEKNKEYTPTTHVGKVYDILMKVGKKYNKKITMHLWADHGGRPLPERIEDKVVIEPWEYKESKEDEIIVKMRKYGGEGKTPVMMGGGVRSVCYDGDYGATRVWCQEGVKYPNVLGITVCLWGTNDVAGRLISFYAGADYAWTPETPKLLKNDTTGEGLRANINVWMRKWQVIFPDAAVPMLNVNRGPEVSLGKYVWPPMANKPIAPTVYFKPE